MWEKGGRENGGEGGGWGGLRAPLPWRLSSRHSPLYRLHAPDGPPAPPRPRAPARRRGRGETA